MLLKNHRQSGFSMWFSVLKEKSLVGQKCEGRGWHQSASVNPKDLQEYYDTYRTQKRETVEQITHELETSVQSLVGGLS